MPAGEWPHSFLARPALGFVFSQSAKSSAPHIAHAPHAMGAGTTTRSPTASFRTPGPTSTTSPMNSRPRMSPRSICGTRPP